MSDLFLTLYLDKPLWMWAVFLALVLILVAVDLGLFNKKEQEIGVRKSLSLSGFYIAISLIFGAWVWSTLGAQSGIEFYTSYVIEKSLSLDNLFVMAVIFSALKIPRKHQHRVLFWGILGVIILRGLMIGLGAALVHEFEWVLYLFGAFLAFTGVRLLFWDDEDGEHEEAVTNNRLLKFLRKHLNITEKIYGQRFFVRRDKDDETKPGAVLYMTPLLLALLMIELADVVFAVDSVPAVFAITSDTYVVFTSNIFAILGLRALYFTLSAMMARFAYLKYSVALVLIFIGAKVFVPLVSTIDKVPAEISLFVTLALLSSGAVYSLIKTK